MYQRTLRLSLAPCLLAALLCGCGSGSTSPQAPGAALGTKVAGTGRAVFHITWSIRTRLLPQASESIEIRILDGDKVVATKVVPRPAEVRSVVSRADQLPPPPFPTAPTSEVTIEDLPAKKLTDLVRSFPNADGTGVAQAEGRAEIEVKPDETAAVTVTLQSTVDHLDITPKGAQSLKVGETLSLTATPRNLTGEIVLTRPGALLWKSSDTAIATVDAAGLVAAVKDGDCVIEVTEPESGKTASVQVTVGAAQQSVESALVYEPYLRADFFAANIPFDPVGTGSVISSLVFTLEHDTGYYLVRTAPDSLGNHLGYKITVADILAATSLPDSTPPTRGSAIIPSTIVEPIPGYIPPNDLFRRRGNKIYFNFSRRDYPFYPSVFMRITDAAGTEAWMRANEGNGDGIEIIWKNQ